MSNPQSSSFCLLCYRPIHFSNQTAKTLDNVYKFVKTVTRFTRQKQNDSFFDLLKHKELIDCCNKCKDSMETFSKSYHQLKVLQLNLEFMLEKIVGKVDHANRVPARWVHVNNVLEEAFSSDYGKKGESQKRIRNFRQNLIEAGHQRKLQSQPRILLSRTQDFVKAEQVSNSSAITKLPNDQKTETNATKKKSRTKLNKSKTCSKCGKTLKSINGLKIHLEHHKDRNEWRWQCNLCPKKFSTEDNLNAHIRSHTKERPYKCRFCGTAFGYRSNFTRHLKVVHKNVKGAEEEIKRKWFIKPLPEGYYIDNDVSVPPNERNVDSDDEDYTAENLASGAENMMDLRLFYSQDNEYDLEESSGEINTDTIDVLNTGFDNILNSESAGILKDPLIKIKAEHQLVADGKVGKFG